MLCFQWLEMLRNHIDYKKKKKLAFLGWIVQSTPVKFYTTIKLCTTSNPNSVNLQVKAYINQIKNSNLLFFSFLFYTWLYLYFFFILISLLWTKQVLLIIRLYEVKIGVLGKPKLYHFLKIVLNPLFFYLWYGNLQVRFDWFWGIQELVLGGALNIILIYHHFILHSKIKIQNRIIICIWISKPW